MSVDLYVTGSNGRMGRALQRLMVGRHVFWSTRDIADITDRKAIEDSIQHVRPKAVLHLAAMTDVARAEIDRELAYRVNVEGTAHVARACCRLGLPMFFLSTDYVFGHLNRAPYYPSSAHDPANYYGLTKSTAEELVRSKVPHHLIIRTSFKETQFPHAGACTDMYTSADYLDVIAKKLVEVLDNPPGVGVYHLGTERKSLYDLIRQRNPEVRQILRSDVGTPLPEDTSFHPTYIFSETS